MWHDWRGAPTDLLWLKSWHVSEGGPQLTSFGKKKTTSVSLGVKNWPPMVLCRVSYRRPQLTFLRFRLEYFLPGFGSCVSFCSRGCGYMHNGKYTCKNTQGVPKKLTFRILIIFSILSMFIIITDPIQFLAGPNSYPVSARSPKQVAQK